MACANTALVVPTVLAEGERRRCRGADAQEPGTKAPGANL